MNIRHERFKPVGDELDRPAKRHRRRCCRDLIAEGVNLQPERAADVGRDHADIVLGNAQRAREHRLNHVRDLAARIDGQPRRMFVIVGEDGAGLEAHRRVAAEIERPVDNDVGGLHGGVYPASVDHLAEGNIVAEIRMQHGRLRVERGFLVRNRGQLLPLNFHKLGGVLREGARLRHHHHDRLTVPTCPIHGHRILRGRFHAGKAGQRAHPGRRAHLCNIGSGHHLDHARRLATLRLCRCAGFARAHAGCARRRHAACAATRCRRYTSPGRPRHGSRRAAKACGRRSCSADQAWSGAPWHPFRAFNVASTASMMA